MQDDIVEQELRKELARLSFLDYCAYMDPSYERTRAGRLIAEYLEALERREINKLMICLPPRHSKTYHGGERFPAWYLGRNPTHQLILTSYVADLAEESSRKARDLLSNDENPFPVKVRMDVRAIKNWQLEEGGKCIAAGVGGSLTGKGAHLLIMDDLLKGYAESQSPAIRESTWKWYTSVANTRLMKDPLRLFMTTRWHTDDPAGRILNASDGHEWTVLKLVAEIETEAQAAADPLGRQIGEVLWPEWYPHEFLIDIKGPMSLPEWESLYQQSPVIEGGNLIRDDWWQWYLTRPKGMTIEIFVDGAFKTGILNDPSSICTWGTTGLNHYCLSVIREKLEFDDLVAATEAAYERVRREYHQSPPIVIEDQASGQSLYQVLRRKGYNVIQWPERHIKDREYRRLRVSSKIARLEGVSRHLRNGTCWLPRDEPWVKPFMEEHSVFPNGKHDDMVDCTVMALWRFTQFRKSFDRVVPYTRELKLVGQGSR